MLASAQVRMEPIRRSVPASGESKGGDDAPTTGGKESDTPASGQPVGVDKSGGAGAAGGSEELNPDAKPLVTTAASDAPSEEQGDLERGDGDDGDNEDDDDDDDDDESPGDSEAKVAQAEAPSSDEAVETTRWAERGVGQLRLLVPKPLAPGASAPPPHPRLVMRVEHTLRLILNESLLPSTAPAERVSDTSIRLVVVNSTGTPQSFLMRVKTAAEGEQLLARINATIPKA
jgi:hypothetical protein